MAHVTIELGLKIIIGLHHHYVCCCLISSSSSSRSEYYLGDIITLLLQDYRTV